MTFYTLTYTFQNTELFAMGVLTGKKVSCPPFWGEYKYQS